MRLRYCSGRWREERRPVRRPAIEGNMDAYCGNIEVLRRRGLALPMMQGPDEGEKARAG